MAAASLLDARGILSGMRTLAENFGVVDLDAQFAAAEKTLGFSITKDLVPALGNEVALIVNSIRMSGGIPQVDAALAVSVADDQRMKTVLLALESERAQGEAMNLGRDDVPTLWELAAALYRHAGKKEKFISINATLARAAVRVLSRLGLSPLEPQHLEIALRDYVFDNSKAKEILGWNPSRDDIEAAREAYDWYVAHATS